MSDLETRPIIALADSLGQEWTNLREANKAADKAKTELEDLLNSELGRNFASEDGNLVVFGSLARKEWIDYVSDLDWTYLVDGQARSEHLDISQAIKETLPKSQRSAQPPHNKRQADVEYRFGAPGQTATFGNLEFSQPLIRHIGGQDDSNKNTTQRVLLLLESVAVGMHAAHERVVRAIIRRYLEEEPHLVVTEENRFKVPRFLLNDVVRFWRTMAVDFASKQRDRGGEGWGLRNAKLRMSRKLIFASGLLTCFSCHLDQNLQAKIPTGDRDVKSARKLNLIQLENHLWNYTQQTPLDTMASSIRDYGIRNNVAVQLFSAYDEFLGMMSDSDKRKHLKTLRAEQSRTDQVFQQVRAFSNKFQDALNQIFFEHELLALQTRKYGVF
jgi:hypothetical protein